MAPLTRRRKRALAGAPPAIDPADRLSSLPDEILAFLPAQEAVRTCVLAQTWHDVWKFTRRLISLHLTRLGLSGKCFECTGVWFECTDFNLDGCPALEHLEIRNSSLLNLEKIMSPSLKHLFITGWESGNPQRFKISAPCLVSLWLEVGAFRPPLLESMPELVEAYVRIDSYGDINCACGDDPMGCYYHLVWPGNISDGDPDSDNEEDTEDYPQGRVLLEGLAQAKHLVLLSHHSRYIFRRDLRLCPTFSNLKALALNGYWCEPADCRALACILEHEPVLEKLTVLFSEKVELKYDIVFEGCPDATAKSTMTTQCLKTVRVKCHTVHDGRKRSEISEYTQYM